MEELNTEIILFTLPEIKFLIIKSIYDITGEIVDCHYLNPSDSMGIYNFKFDNGPYFISFWGNRDNIPINVVTPFDVIKYKVFIYLIDTKKIYTSCEIEKL